MAKVVVQKLNKTERSELDLAIRYFTILAAVSSVRLTRKQVQILAFAAIKGNISSGAARNGFVEVFNSSKGTIDNLKKPLVMKGLLVKRNNKYVVNPSVILDFKSQILLEIKLDIEPNGQPEDGEDQN